jgi:hypothetical protein
MERNAVRSSPWPTTRRSEHRRTQGGSESSSATRPAITLGAGVRRSRGECVTGFTDRWFNRQRIHLFRSGAKFRGQRLTAAPARPIHRAEGAEPTKHSGGTFARQLRSKVHASRPINYPQAKRGRCYDRARDRRACDPNCGKNSWCRDVTSRRKTTSRRCNRRLDLLPDGWTRRRYATLRRRSAMECCCVGRATALAQTLPRSERPARRVVHGRRHRIPRSGNRFDSFPSGHALHLGALASALTRTGPSRLRPFIWPTAIGLASTRLLLLAHYVSDVVAGLVLGVATDCAIAALFARGPARRK